jgi:TolB protein
LEIAVRIRALLLGLTCLAAPALAQDVPPVTLNPPAGAQPPQLSAQAAPGQTPPPLEVDVTGGISAPMPIAIPAMPTPAVTSTAAGSTDALGRQLSDIIANDLRASGLFTPIPPAQLRTIMFPEVTAPAYDYWGGTGAQALVQGYIRANGDGSLTVGCYLYDVTARAELVRQGFVVPPSQWRRAAHKCADAIYARLTGEGPYFDSRVVYVSETGPKGNRIKRLAIMDQDGANHRFLTAGSSIVLTPRFAPNQQSIVYMSYVGKNPAIYVYDIGTGKQRRWILFSRADGGNTDIYRVSSAGGGTPQKLTNSPGIDTGGSYSPDGSRIVFESDRSGGQQIYVMNADGSNQQRISFGGGRYATPVWSPRGDLIAFTKLAGSFRIGVMSPNGSGEKLLTDGNQDEGPSWSPNGRVITFFRSGRGSAGKADLWSVDLTGVNARRIPTPLDGSDPAWGPLQP